MKTRIEGYCVTCPGGGYACGDPPVCPEETRTLIGSMGTIQFDIELWGGPEGGAPFTVVLVPVLPGPEGRAK
jgi:hypothetical protein